MTAFKFSRRASKYVWLTLPGLFSIALTGLWLVVIAPSVQKVTREETRWRQSLQAQKQRQEFAQANQIFSDYDQLIFQGTTANQADLKTIIWVWSQRPENQIYRDGQTVRLLDQYHTCIGYLIAPDGIYLEGSNPGLCKTSLGDIPSKLETANPL